MSVYVCEVYVFAFSEFAGGGFVDGGVGEAFFYVGYDVSSGKDEGLVDWAAEVGVDFCGIYLGLVGVGFNCVYEVVCPFFHLCRLLSVLL